MPPLAPQRVGEAVQAVADDAVDALDAGGGEGLDHLVSDSCGHRPVLLFPHMF
jgi:hypothetical protein